MDVQTAQGLLYALLTVELAVWLAGLVFVAGAARRIAPPEERFEPADPARPPLSIRGGAEVEGQPGPLAARAASVLAQGGILALGAVRIIDRTTDRVEFEGGPTFGRASRSLGVRQGWLSFTALDSQHTRVEYAVEPRGRTGLLRTAVVLQGLGLVVLGIGAWLVQSYLVNHPRPAVRGQTLQILQAIHFLWPPFLLAGLYRWQKNVVRTGMQTFVENLPYYEG